MKLPFLTPRQTSHCSNCALVITERKRKPCPRCGDMRRSHERTANESLGSADKPS